jgi:hypothetical protein
LRTIICVGVMLLFTAPAAAQDICFENDLQEELQFLRRVSLDLRGRLPSDAEVDWVVNSGQVGDGLLDDMLESEDFLHQMAEYHRSLLWTNLERVRLSPFSWNLGRSRVTPGGPFIYWMGSNARATRFRGVREPCLDRSAQFEPGTNEIIFWDDPERPNIKKEGWVWVTPYWDTTTQIRVCAADAQFAETGSRTRGGNPSQMMDCSTSGAFNSTYCGCGENLRYCQFGNTTRLPVVRSWNVQLERLVQKIVASDRPYTEVLTAKDMDINGPIHHFLTHQNNTGGNFIRAEGTLNHDLPTDLTYEDFDTWQPVNRDALHAGLLTLPGFLMKFQSNRGRANRFYNAFRCEPFEAPPDGLPASDSSCHDDPNLTTRCGCSYCHVGVEPAAAYWGRFAEAGIRALNDDDFPVFDQNCIDRPYLANCRNYYYTDVVDAEKYPVLASYRGKLRSYLFADDHLGEAGNSFASNIEEGPLGIAQKAITDGSFEHCATQRMWSHLLGREVRSLEAAQVTEIAERWGSEGFNLKALVRTIVTAPAYRRAGNFDEEAAR